MIKLDSTARIRNAYFIRTYFMINREEIKIMEPFLIAELHKPQW